MSTTGSRRSSVVGVVRRMKLRPGLERRHAELGVFLGRQVDDDQAIDAGRERIADERVDAVDVDRVVVAHQHDRRGVVGLAELGDHRQGLVERLAGLERALAGRLDARPVGHRIGERHSELDEVGAGAPAAP